MRRKIASFLVTLLEGAPGRDLHAIATRSSVAWIPIMIDTLTQKLRFRAAVVELLVPLRTALVRAGPIFPLPVPAD